MTIPEDKFISVYNENYKKLYLYSKTIVKDVHRAQEAAQEVFLRLWKQDFEKIEGHLNQWLFTVCYNHSLKTLAKNQRYVEAFEDDSIDESRNPSEQLDFEEQKNTLKKCMRKLTPRQREVIKLRFTKDLSYERAANKMKTSSGNIGFMLSTTIQKLKKMILKELDK